MIRSAFVANRTVFLLLSTAGLMTGCSSLPTSGPTAHQVIKGAEKSQPPLQFQVVDLNAGIVDQLRADDRTLAAKAPTLAQLADAQARVDTIGPGDVLQVNIFEVGISLFSAGGGITSQTMQGGFDSSAHPVMMPDRTVDSQGRVALPYLPVMNVAGMTTQEVENLINKNLRGKSQTPQAVVSIKTNISNTAFISGDVNKPGRFELTLNRERLLDAIAASGGSQNSAEDTVIRFSRNGHMLEERMGFIRAGSADDLALIPGDRIELIKRPRSYTTFGAVRTASQTPFQTGDVSLAEAIARAGGPSDSAADASAVFLFRYDSVPDAENAELPKLYRLNLLQPASYLIAQRMKIRDKDVLFFANAALNQPSKLVAVLNQLFSPFVTAKAVGGF